MRAAARELDYDRYLTALLAPNRARDGLMALAAFHGEIARIPLHRARTGGSRHPPAMVA